MGGQDVPDPLSQGRIILREQQRFIEDLSKDRQHLLFQIPVLVLKLVQVLVGGGRHTLHAFEEHLHQLIAGLHLRLREETAQETPAPPRMDVAHIPNLEGVRLCSKLPDLRMRNPREQRLGRQDRFQPGQAIQPLAEMHERRLAGRGLHPRKLGRPVIAMEEGIKPCLL